jgi:hypothetical protein
VCDVDREGLIGRCHIEGVGLIGVNGCGVWYVGVWGVVCGVWCVVRGVWCVVCGV